MDLRVLDHIVIGRGEYVSLPNAAGFNPLCAILRDLCLSGLEHIAESAYTTPPLRISGWHLGLAIESSHRTAMTGL